SRGSEPPPLSTEPSAYFWMCDLSLSALLSTCVICPIFSSSVICFSNASTRSSLLPAARAVISRPTDRATTTDPSVNHLPTAIKRDETRGEKVFCISFVERNVMTAMLFVEDRSLKRINCEDVVLVLPEVKPLPCFDMAIAKRKHGAAIMTAGGLFVRGDGPPA